MMIFTLKYISIHCSYGKPNLVLIGQYSGNRGAIATQLRESTIMLQTLKMSPIRYHIMFCPRNWLVSADLTCHLAIQ